MKPRRDFISYEEGIVVDVNKPKEDGWERGDNQLEVDKNDGVEKNWKDNSNSKLYKDKQRSKRKQLILVPTELEDEVQIDNDQLGQTP